MRKNNLIFYILLMFFLFSCSKEKTNLKDKVFTGINSNNCFSNDFKILNTLHFKGDNKYSLSQYGYSKKYNIKCNTIKYGTYKLKYPEVIFKIDSLMIDENTYEKQTYIIKGKFIHKDTLTTSNGDTLTIK